MDGHVITQISRVYRLLFLLAMVLHCALLARGSSAIIPLRKKKHDAFGRALKPYVSVLGFFNEIHSYQHIPSHYFGKPGAQLHS